MRALLALLNSVQVERAETVSVPTGRSKQRRRALDVDGWEFQKSNDKRSI
jgi:hypothetical protein